MKKDWDKIESIKRKTVENSSLKMNVVDGYAARMINMPMGITEGIVRGYLRYPHIESTKDKLCAWGVYLRTYIEIYPEDEHHEERVKALEYYNNQMKELGLKAE